MIQENAIHLNDSRKCLLTFGMRYFCIYIYRLSPFVFFYGTVFDLDLVIDASDYGNDARFIRRSCQPNAAVSYHSQLFVSIDVEHMYVIMPPLEEEGV